jgi:hypothetical protein
MNTAFGDLQARSEQERTLYQEEKAVMASKIEVLTSQLAAERYKSDGEQERIKHNAQVHELEGGLSQSSRWLMPDIHAQRKDDTLAGKQSSKTAETADTFATASEASRRPAGSVVPIVQLLEEVGPRRTKRRRIA